MTHIPFEDIQAIVTFSTYAALVPFLGFSYLRKNPKGLILKTLKQEFPSIQKITPREFYGPRPLLEREKLKCERYFVFEDSTELENIKSFLEQLLTDHGYKIFFSFAVENQLCKISISKRNSTFKIEILSGTHVSNSFRVSII